MKHFTFSILAILFTFSAFTQIVITEINYNPPGIDLTEFIELYNNSDAAIDLEGYSFDQGVNYTFPAVSLGAGEFILISEDSVALKEYYNADARQWTSGSLSNGGEDIILIDPDGTVIDIVDYEDDEGWPELADGSGYSIVLCDINADNNVPESWKLSTVAAGTLPTRTYYASPSALEECITEPIVRSLETKRFVLESTDTLDFTIFIENANMNTSEISISVDEGQSTASSTDFSLETPTATFDGEELPQIVLTFSEDAEIEGQESVLLNLSTGDNVGTVFPSAIEIVIYDNDAELENGMVLTGVFDADPDNGKTFSGVEIYALQDIEDISNYAIGFANNGGGTDGIEVEFPAISVAAGDFLYVTTDNTRFNNFFGFAPTVVSNEAFVTGDDAIELFESGRVIDTYGEIEVDGTDQLWEYSNGWQYREADTGPDGATFVQDHWLGSNELLIDADQNESVLEPFPIGTYQSVRVGLSKTIAAAEVFEIFPTPTSDYINIKLKQNADYQIIEEVRVMNRVGQTVLISQLTDTVVDVQSLPNGLYYLDIQTEDRHYVQSFVVSR